ncbi:hypothetical protein BHE74_00054399 [Ensete ventricosum]|nr:hypothetical protein BHE74_00054399 [Ensete ventricosum]
MRGQRRAQLLQRRAAAVWSERALLVVFNLLLVAKEVGSKRSPLAAIKEDGSERLLLAVLCGEGSLLVVIKVDGSISSIPYSHERRALIVKGTEEMENTDVNSKYQDKVEGQRPRNFIRPMSTGFSSR